MPSSLAVSACASFDTGIFVHDATMWAMSASVTLSVLSCSARLSAHSASRRCFSRRSFSSRSRIAAAFSNSCDLTTDSFSCLTWRIWFSISRISAGGSVACRRTRDEASSIKSTALSGRKRSEMYRSPSFAAATSASSVIVTLWCAS